MPARTKLTVYDDQGEVIGWIRNHGCDNPECTTAVVNGKPWHAIPRHGILSEYHYGNLDRALDALHAVVGI